MCLRNFRNFLRKIFRIARMEAVMGREENLLNIIIALGVFFLGFTYLARPLYKKLPLYIDWDKRMFPDLNDDKISLKADKLLFIVCLIMGTLILINGLLAYFFNMDNISMIFLLVVFLTWPIRILYIYFYVRKRRKQNK